MTLNRVLFKFKERGDFNLRPITPSSNIIASHKPLSCYLDRMIKTYVQTIARKRGLTTAYQLQKALNIAPSVAAKLWSDDFEMISKTSLERLCRLLKTTPGELITFKRTPSAKRH